MAKIYVASSWRNEYQPEVVAALRKADLDAMLWAETCVLVLPCGRSAHTEAGCAQQNSHAILTAVSPQTWYLQSSRPSPRIFPRPISVATAPS